MNTNINIELISVKEKLPTETKRGYEETQIQGASNRLLVLVKDKGFYFARFFKNKHMTNPWNLEGVSGTHMYEITHFAELPEQ